MSGILHDTYHAALQHNHVEPNDEDLVLAVVAEQMYGIQKYTDQHANALAPPKEALREFKDLANEIGHNEAVDELDFDSRFREHVRTDEDTQQAIETVVRELEHGRDVWLVCYENTEDKFCHREILREEIEAKRGVSV